MFPLPPLFVALALSPPAGTEQASPRFGEAAHYVEVDVIIQDQSGDTVSGLQVEDFELFEDGRRQDILSVQSIDLPARPPASPVGASEAFETDVRSNQLTTEGRVFVIVLDDLHTEASRSTRVRDLAREFIEKWVGVRDLVAVVHTSGREASSSLSSGKATLLEAVEGFRGSRLRSVAMARLQREEEMRRVRREQDVEEPAPAPIQQERDLESNRDPLYAERSQRAVQTLRMLHGVCGMLEAVKGRRKAVVVISEGLDEGLDDVTGAGGAPALADEVRRIVGEAGRANVSIYLFDPAGVAAPGPRIDEAAPEARDVGPLQSEESRRQDSLQTLATETGGWAALSPGALTAGLQRIAEDTSHYYLLRYDPKKPPGEGAYRRIEVRVNDADLSVRARAGYSVSSVVPREDTDRDDKKRTAPSRDPFAFMGEESPLPLTGLPLKLFAAPRGSFSETVPVSVLLDMEVGNFQFDSSGNKLRDEVEIRVTAFDLEGKIAERQHRVLTLDVEPRTHRSMLRHGLRVLSRIDLHPGTYRLRVFALERGGGHRGSVFYDLEVPSCGKRSLVMGGLVVGSLKETIVPIVAGEDEKAGFSFPPSTRRTFTADDELLIQTEICNAATAQTEVSTVVRGAEGSTAVDLDEHYRGTSSSATVHYARVPLKGLPPGPYSLEVVARDPESRFQSRREVHFEIAGSGERR